MNPQALRRSEPWAREQSKVLLTDLPDRQPGEPPAAESQLLQIRALVRSIDEAELARLGQVQAEVLLERLQAGRDAFTIEKTAEYLLGPTASGPAPSQPAKTPVPSRPAILADLLIIAIITLLIVRWFAGSWSGFLKLFH